MFLGLMVHIYISMHTNLIKGAFCIDLKEKEFQYEAIFPQIAVVGRANPSHFFCSKKIVLFLENK